MKKALIFLSALVVVSCIHTDTTLVQPGTATQPQQTDANWIRLEIPTGREAYAIAGDIDKTLLVTTWTKAYYTTDQGKTWQESKDFQGPVPGLFVRNDTTFSLQSYQTNDLGIPVRASSVYYFTPDYGRTWQRYSQYFKGYLEVVQAIGQSQSAGRVSYSIKRNTTPISPGSYYENPSQIFRQEPGGQQEVSFPFKSKLINLYVDTQNRLYVGASGGSYDPQHDSFYCCTPDMPAVVYVSRKSFP